MWVIRENNVELTKDIYLVDIWAIESLTKYKCRNLQDMNFLQISRIWL